MIAPAGRCAQATQLAALLLPDLLQISNADMLRRTASDFGASPGGSETARMVAGWSLVLDNHVHPVALLILEASQVPPVSDWLRLCWSCPIS